MFLLGLGFVATGLWFIASEHTRTASCKAPSTVLPGASTACQTVGWMYFAGFAIAGIGVMVLLFSSLMRRHQLRYRRQQRAASTEIEIRMRASGSAPTRRSGVGSAGGGRLGSASPAPPG